jgi:hypothetical protein
MAHTSKQAIVRNTRAHELDEAAADFLQAYLAHKTEVIRALRLSDKAVELGYDDPSSDAFLDKVVAMLVHINLHAWDTPVVELVKLLAPLSTKFKYTYDVLVDLQMKLHDINWYDDTYAKVARFQGCFERVCKRNKRIMSDAIKQDQRGAGARRFTRFLTVKRGERAFDVQKVERVLNLECELDELVDAERFLYRLHFLLPDLAFPIGSEETGGVKQESFQDVADALGLHAKKFKELMDQEYTPPDKIWETGAPPQAKKQKKAK